MVASLYSEYHKDSLYIIADYTTEERATFWVLEKSENTDYTLSELLKSPEKDGIITLEYSYPLKESIKYLIIKIHRLDRFISYEYITKEKFKLDF